MVVVAGGTGRLGRAVVDVLVRRGERVRVMTRDRSRARGLEGPLVEVVEGDVLDPSSLRPALAGATAVVSSIQGLDDPKSSPARTDDLGNRNLVDAARDAGARHFVLVSALWAAPDHPMEMQRAKFAAERYLKGSGLGWTIIRPPAFIEFWVAMVGAPLVSTGKTRIFGRGRNPMNFVSVKDVAIAVDRALSDPALLGVELDMGGPENLTMEQVVAVIERVTGKKGQVGHVPLPVMRVMSIAMRPFNRAMARIVKTAVWADTIDQTWDGAENLRSYPWLPQTSLEEVLRRDATLVGAR